MFICFLTHIFHRGVIPGGVPDRLEILAGVPQCPIFSPLLFKMFINDIVKEVYSNLRLFADVTSLNIHVVVYYPGSASQMLNLVLERLDQWAVQWLVNYNRNTTESVLLFRMIIVQDHPILFINDVLI